MKLFKIQTHQARIYFTVGALISLAILKPVSLFAQGSLIPPGPPGPTMKTLSQIEPRTPISSLPFLITNSGAYYLTTNLVGIPGTNGITIAADDVSLDLNGFSLIGVGGSGDGIKVGLAFSDYYTNLAVFHGTIRNWDQNGVNAYPAGYNSRFEHLHLLYNKVGGLVAGTIGTVRQCMAMTNGSYGLFGFYTLFDSCIANQNGGEGIYGGSSRFVNCMSQWNAGSGIRAFNASHVSGCLCASNGRSGIALGIDSVAIGNDCAGNNIISSGVDAGILAFYGPARIEGNHVSYSTGFGIMVIAGQTNVVVIKNTTAGNTNNISSIPPGNDVGPWGKAATSTSPWANLYN